MSDIVSPLLQWLNANPQLAGLATFVISAGESVAIVGTVVPGSITMTAIGTLAGAGIIPLWSTVLWAILGAIVGDGISYWIGHYFKDGLRNMWPFRDNPGVLQKGEVFVHKYGVMSVFIGRFVGPVRALVPVVAGMLGMKPLQFTIANVASAIGWAPAYMLPGILLGAASLELPPDIALHVILVFFLIVLFTILCVWFLWKMGQLIHLQIDQMQSWLWQRCKRSRILSPVTYLLKHYDHRRSHGQLNAAVYALIISLLFIALAAYVKWIGSANIMVNDAMYHLFRGIRNEVADKVMINFTLLGQRQVIFPVILAIFAWLIFSRRWRMAIHALALTIFTVGSIFAFKHWVASPRPWGIFGQPEGYSLPSGHATLATTLFLGLAFLIAASLQRSRRWMVYLPAFLLILLVSFSRVYLGAHWFTDILAAWLLGGALLILVIISYERRTQAPVNAMGLSLIASITFIFSYGFYHHQHFNSLTTSYELLNWPTVEVAMKDWWQKNNEIPAFRTSLFGFPSQRINIEWVGDIDKIHNTLIKQGWTKPPVRNWISTMHRVADISSTQYLPLVSPQYLDKKPAITLTRRVNGGKDNDKSLLVIRLWDSSRVIKNSHDTLWVGFVGAVPRSYSWIVKKHSGELEASPRLVFTSKQAIKHWEWKAIVILLPKNSIRTYDQKILLIRPVGSSHKK